MATVKRKRGRPSAVEALVATVQDQFDPITLPAPIAHPATAAAQDRLAAALSSVNSVLLSMNLSRAVDRRVKKRALRGRLSESQIDILRAALAFSGAGLDAALKKLIQDTVRQRAVRNTLAKKKFLDFLDRHLASPDSPIDRRQLAEVLIDTRGPQAALLDHYERDLTGDSLQSAEQVATVCGALGVDKRALRERLKPGSTLDLMFRARNEIVHQLDLSDTGRTTRTLPVIRAYAEEALAVAQEIVNAVGEALGAD